MVYDHTFIYIANALLIAVPVMIICISIVIVKKGRYDGVKNKRDKS